MEVIWKRYKDTIYEVSNMGKVRNTNSGKMLKTEGKRNIALCKEGGRRGNRSISNMVATAFIANPDNLKYTTAINGDHTDSRATNLKWTKREEKEVKLAKWKEREIRTISMDKEDWEKIKEIRGSMKAREFMHLIANTVKIEYTKNGSKTVALHKQVSEIGTWLGTNFPELNEEGLNRKEQELLADGTITQIDKHWVIREEI